VLERCQIALTFVLILLFGFVSAASAQSTTDTTQRATANGGEIRGRIVGLGTGQPVTTGSISVRGGSDTSFVAGANAESDGSFHIAGLNCQLVAATMMGGTALTRM